MGSNPTPGTVVLSRDIVRICLGTSFHLTIPPEGLATVAISVIATAPRPSSEWAQLGASAGRESSRPRTSAQQRRRATGALALRGCGLGLASDLEWSCRTTLVHVLAALLSDAINLATRSTELRFSGQADPSFSVPELLDALEGGPQFLPWYARRPRPRLAGHTTRPMPRLLARPRRGLAGRVGSTPDRTRHDDPAV